MATATQIEFLRKSFQVTTRCIRAALSYSSKSDLADKIRKLAVMKGAVDTLELPVKETIHDADGVMTQDLGKGWMLKADKRSGEVILTRRGHVIERRQNPTLSEIVAMQERAMA